MEPITTVQRFIDALPSEDRAKLSDGFHSFEELYETSSESFLTQDLSKEIDFFSDQKDAMIDTVLMLFEDKLNENDLQSLKKSLERTWDNGFRYGFSKNSH